MSKATAKYNPDLNSHEDNQHHRDDLRLHSDERINEIALLSKRKARLLLRVGNITLKKLIDDGDIKIIMVNGKEKIPYLSLQEFIRNMKTKKDIEANWNEFLDEENSIAMANKIIYKFNKGEI